MRQEGVALPVFDDRTLGATTGGCRTRSVAHKALVAERHRTDTVERPIVSIEHVARNGADAIEHAAGPFLYDPMNDRHCAFRPKAGVKVKRRLRIAAVGVAVGRKAVIDRRTGLGRGNQSAARSGGASCSSNSQSPPGSIWMNVRHFLKLPPSRFAGGLHPPTAACDLAVRPWRSLSHSKGDARHSGGKGHVHQSFKEIMVDNTAAA